MADELLQPVEEVVIREEKKRKRRIREDKNDKMDQIARIKRRIEDSCTKNETLQKNERGEKYLDVKMNTMQDEGAKKKYVVKQGNTKIDSVNQAVTYISAEVIQISEMTKSEIVFVNGDLLMNSELQIHPQAVEQLLIVMDTGPNAKSDLQKAMELTKQRKADTYQKQIRLVLKDYEMITRTEIEEAKKLINNQYRNMPEGELTSRLDSLTPADTYRMRTVLLDAPKDGLQLAAEMAKRYGDTSIHTLAAFVEIVKKVDSDHQKENQSNVKDAIKAMSIEDWRNFLITRQQKEKDGRIHDGVEKSVAESETAERFTKLIKAKEAELNYRRMIEARKQNPSGVSAEELKAAETRMLTTNKDSDKKNAKYIKYHDESVEEWLLGTRSYATELLKDGEAFNTKWAEITEGVTEAEKWLKQNLAFHSSVAAYYHLMKHGDDTRQYFNEWKEESKHDDQNAELYFKTMMNHIFFGANSQNYRIISQDGQRTSTTYWDQMGYKGVTKCTYDVHLRCQTGIPSVATHYPIGKAKTMVSD